MLYVRKISLAKWTQLNYSETNKISADAVTGSIRTSGNELSLWQLDDKQNIEDTAALALICALQDLEKIELLILDGKELENIDMSLSDTKGQTHVSDLADTHTDIKSLDYDTLGVVAHYFAKRLQDKDNIVQITRETVKKILLKAISDKRLNIDDLSKKLKEKISK